MQHRMGTPFSEIGPHLVPVPHTAGRSGYFAEEREGLDPRLFYEETDVLREDVRLGLLGLLFDFLRTRYHVPEGWAHAWLAGSAITRQWSGDTEVLGDLDVLVGIDGPGFFQANPAFRGFSEKTIAQHMNAQLREELWPATANWRGFETTFYVNPGTGTDIRSINPYAAYGLTTAGWAVRPPDLGEDWGPDKIDETWWAAVGADIAAAEDLVARYNRLVDEARGAPEGPRKLNLLREVQLVVEQVAARYRIVHGERTFAFRGVAGTHGAGFLDYYNFRWQMFKKSGLASTMRDIMRVGEETQRAHAEERYGAPIAADVLTPSTLLDLT